MRSLDLFLFMVMAVALAALGGCSSGASDGHSIVRPAQPGDAGGGGSEPDAGGGGGGSSAPELKWSIREVEFGGTATPSASVTIGGYKAWADGGDRWKAVIPSHLLDLDHGEDLELSAQTVSGGRSAARIGIHVQD